MTVAIESMTDAQASTLFAAQVRSVSFNATVPLDGDKVMAAQTVSEAIAFTPGASPVLGAQAYARLTADGSHAPTFAGFTEHGSSAGYLNTSGVINLIRFWYDGTTAYFAVSQALNAVPFVMQSAAIANATPTQIQITFDRALNASIVPAASAFAITNSGGTDTVSGVSISGNTVTLTKSRTTLATDVVSVAYTAPGSNPITDTNGNVAGSSSTSVTNGITSGNFLRLVNKSGSLNESVDSPGYDYIATGAVSYSGANGYPNNTLPANADGWIAYDCQGSASGGPIMGFSTSATPSTYFDCVLAIYYDGGSWNYLINGSSSSTSIAVSAGQIPRVRRAGTTLIGEVSNDGGTTWTQIGSTTVSTAALKPLFITGNNQTGNKIVKPRASANVV